MLWLLFTILYVQTGFQLGKKTAKVWKKGDSESLESFLCFPVNHVRGKVGDPNAPLVGAINEGDVLFRTLMTLGWPVWAAWNLLVIGGLLGPDKVIRRLTGQHKADRYKALEASILKEEKRVDKVIRRLEGPKRQRKPRAAKAPKALPAMAAREAEPPAFIEPPPLPAAVPVFEPPPPADPVPPPVQVRVTVDVTASGPATEETVPAEHDARINTAPDKEKVVH
ncbi:MAG TPA: hypothetical protein VL426_00130 [Candidatus Binatia bacterium]|jgi:hypothetical protein|nr:hypothetical protein [Candidatus Binatia bacterium]